MMRAIIPINIVLLSLAACHRAPNPPPAASSVDFTSSSARQDRVLRGVYPGKAQWRWTAPIFAFALDPPAVKSAYLELDFTFPAELGEQAVTVVATVNHTEVARMTYAKPDRYLLSCRVPEKILTRRPAEVEFSVDRSFTDPITNRPQGFIVVSVGLMEYERSAEFRAAALVDAHKGYEKILEQRNLQIPAANQREIMRVFHDLPIWKNMWFLNVPIIKNPLDLWMLQQIAYEVRPDFVIETGTWQGGSALYWAHTLDGMGLENTRVLTVDIQDLPKQAAASHPLWKKYVEFSQSSSTDPVFVAKLAKRVEGRRVIVNLDSDHSMRHVLEELRMYAPLVNPGSYIAVEDTHIDGVPTNAEFGPGPMAAVRRFLAEGGSKNFEQDFTREALVMTSYPGGWLRRKLH